MTSDGTVIATVLAAGGAQDAAGNNNTASTSTDNTVTYDATAPTSMASSPTYSTSTTFTVSYSVLLIPAATRSGVKDVELWVRAPGGAFTEVATDTAGLGTGIDGTFSFTGTVDGTYEVYTRAHDVAGNYELAPAGADDSTLLDTKNPTSLASSPAYSTSTTFTVTYTASDPLMDSSASGLNKVELYMQGPGDLTFAFIGTDNTPNATPDFEVTVGADGQYRFYTIATDAAGNVEAAPVSADTTTFVDSAPPISAATSPAYDTDGAFTVSYTANDPGSNPSGLASVKLYVDGPGAGGYVLAATDSTPTASGSFSFTAAEGDGQYRFYTIATDAAGNVEAAPVSADTTTFVDSAPPISAATSPAYDTDGAFTVSYTANDPARTRPAWPRSSCTSTARVPAATSWPRPTARPRPRGASASPPLRATASTASTRSPPMRRATSRRHRSAPTPPPSSTRSRQLPQSPSRSMAPRTARLVGHLAVGPSQYACGTASDPAPASGVSKVEFSLQQVSTGMYWNGTSFSTHPRPPRTSEARPGARRSRSVTSRSPGQYTLHVKATDVAGNTQLRPTTSTFQINRYSLDYLSPIDDSTPTTTVLNTGKNGRVIPGSG